MWTVNGDKCLMSDWLLPTIPTPIALPPGGYVRRHQRTQSNVSNVSYVSHASSTCGEVCSDRNKVRGGEGGAERRGKGRGGERGENAQVKWVRVCLSSAAHV